ncbi:MAG: hypothetical protein ACOWWM_13320 [Desulfobacterales bacterium]
MVFWMKATILWILLVPLGILNGIFRERILAPILGARIALPISGLSLSLLILTVTAVAIPWLPEAHRSAYWAAGGVWALLTVAFELALGRWGMKQSWGEIVRNYDFRTGNLMLIVVLAAAVAPYLGARLRGLI